MNRGDESLQMKGAGIISTDEVSIEYGGDIITIEANYPARCWFNGSTFHIDVTSPGVKSLTFEAAVRQDDKPGRFFRRQRTYVH